MGVRPKLDYVISLLEDVGLKFRGGLHPVQKDAVPKLPSGKNTTTLLLVGNVGNSLRQIFSETSPNLPRVDGDTASTLDDWSRETLGLVAEKLGGADNCVPLFPFIGPPFLPFLKWAQRAEPVFQSPIGPLIHPDHGLWHAYRGALAFPTYIELPPLIERENPCEKCSEKPCVKACPVQAHAPPQFKLSACISHIKKPEGETCMVGGCMARRACPVGKSGVYTLSQIRFHMRAFQQRHNNEPKVS